jgi:hypothetical protein
MAKMICTACGTADRPKTVTKGSTLIELILWLCLLIPGLIYSIWRLTSRHDACSQCGSESIVPLDSPVGRRLAKEFHPYEDFTPAAELIGRKIGSMFASRK